MPRPGALISIKTYDCINRSDGLAREHNSTPNVPFVFAARQNDRGLFKDPRQTRRRIFNS
jgi:hypothetical protein